MAKKEKILSYYEKQQKRAIEDAYDLKVVGQTLDSDAINISLRYWYIDKSFRNRELFSLLFDNYGVFSGPQPRIGSHLQIKDIALLADFEASALTEYKSTDDGQNPLKNIR